MKIPIFVALDVDCKNEALTLAKKVAPYVGGFKLGPRLLIKYGESIIQEVAKLGEVFVDNKYHDIPSTVYSAVQSTFDAGATYVTIHASNGHECLKKLAQLERELNKQRFFKILVVTVLTSFDENNKPSNWQDKPLSDQVYDLAREAFSAGLSGIVCSGVEVKSLKEKFPQGFFVTPGIRLAENSADDQKRILTPGEAIRRGASALVVGRPIVKAQQPEEAASRFAQAISM
ncbi:MAG: orotidine-5'-phosphate decarboxylase [Bdellovibrionales bacterium]|nr:orotidine-5'-phosphate decarboxylase [Bdellovibrionales bacterium]